MIEFYCGINETKWNYHPVDPGKYVCVVPVYGSREDNRKENRVFVPEGSIVLQDCGAFSDGPSNRLTYEQAFERQLRHAKKYNYAHMIAYMADYDLLIDEKWHDGIRKKERWTEEDAWEAVEVTVGAAKFISKCRDEIPYKPGLVISAQGVSPTQYFECVKGISPYIDTERDILGLGGWCIIGRMRKQMMPIFEETIPQVISYASKIGVRKVHIFGVIFPLALGFLLRWCDKYGIALSTDSAGPNKKPALGSWGYGDWIDKNYQRPPTAIRGSERARHVRAVREWLYNFRDTRYYRNGDYND